jgi:phosphoserine aminotransferase
VDAGRGSGLEEAVFFEERSAMPTRPFNFSPGPSILPLTVLEEAAAALVSLPEAGGLSVAEISHRGPVFEALADEAKARLRRLLDVPDSHDILFLQGGARGQFAQLALNFLAPGAPGAYVDTGVWARGAFEEAATLGEASVIASGEGDGYHRLPDLAGLVVPPGAAYVHSTSNNTIYGTQWNPMPDFGAVPHISDMSSDILSRKLDVSRYAMIYAGAQKNAGLAGLTLVIIDRAFMETGRRDIPQIWQYRVQSKQDSMFNTPPTFAIYVTLLVARWLEALGGLGAMEALNAEKAARIYATIDGSGGFYRGTVADPAHRSRMNVTFRLPSEDLERRFVAEADAAGLQQLKGHRKAGGIRASLYNAMPLEGVKALADFMDDFRARVG